MRSTGRSTRLSRRAISQALAAGADIDALDENGASFLHRAAGAGQRDLVRWLLEAGANPRVEDENGWLPIHQACRDNHAGVVAEFLDQGFRLSTLRRRGGERCLHLAAESGDVSLCKLLLARGDGLEVRDGNDNTPLFYAVEGRPKTLAFLLERGAKVNVTNGDGASPLGKAVGWHLTKSVARLLRAGADPSFVDGDGTPVLHAAAESGEVELVRLLLDAGADPTARDAHGNTALSLAREHFNEEAAALLASVAPHPKLRFRRVTLDEVFETTCVVVSGKDSKAALEEIVRLTEDIQGNILSHPDYHDELLGFAFSRKGARALVHEGELVEDYLRRRRSLALPTKYVENVIRCNLQRGEPLYLHEELETGTQAMEALLRHGAPISLYLRFLKSLDLDHSVAPLSTVALIRDTRSARDRAQLARWLASAKGELPRVMRRHLQTRPAAT